MSKQKKILVVDDDRSLLNALSFMLTTEGYKVITNTGHTVLKEVLRSKPDIILLDVLLSGGDGRDICKKIKENKSSKNIPVILLSAHPSIGRVYKKYLADEFLAKPFDNEQLLSLISKYIQ